MKKIFAFTVLLFCSVLTFAQTSRPIVRDIDAELVSTNKVKVSWKLDKSFPASSLVVFKSTQPIVTKQQLYTIKPLGELPRTAIAFTDTLKKYEEYYYAIIAKNEDGSLYDVVLPATNATVTGVKAIRPEPVKQEKTSAMEKLYPDGKMREIPLPYLNMIDDLYKKPNKLNPKVTRIGKELADGHKAAPVQTLEPYVFEEDMVSTPGGDEYFLFEILKNTFIKKHYYECSVQLKKFLSVNRNEKVTNRAVFYLGECWYFQGQYRNSINSFLYTEDVFPALSKKWIESTLNLYRIPE